MLQRFFQFIAPKESAPEPDFVEIAGQMTPLVFRKHPRARKYVLRLQADRTVQVTVPRGGTKKFAREFVAKRKSWLEKQWRVLETRHIPPKILLPGMQVLFRGELCPLNLVPGAGWNNLQVGGDTFPLDREFHDLRPPLEAHLLALARKELPPRVLELAKQHAIEVGKIVVRNQRSRWGSCSHRKTISLNWRLIQIPAEARDYIIIHELMHVRHLNHSAKFWAAVEAAFPDYRRVEKWLRENSGLIGF